MLHLNEIRRDGYDDGIHDRPYSDESYTLTNIQLGVYVEAFREGKRDAKTLAADDARRERDERLRGMRERGEL